MMNSPTRDNGIERDFFTKGEDASVTSGEGMLENKCISYLHCVCVWWWWWWWEEGVILMRLILFPPKKRRNWEAGSKLLRVGRTGTSHRHVGSMSRDR